MQPVYIYKKLFLAGFLLTGFFLLPNTSKAAINLIQTASSTGNGSTVVIDSSKGWSSSGAGNLIIVGIASNASTTRSFSDNKGNTSGNQYVLATSTTDVNNNQSIAIYYMANSQSGITSITYNTNYMAYGTVFVSEFSGIDTSSPLDKFATNYQAYNAPTTWDTGITATTTKPNELVYALIGQHYIGTATWATSTGYTLLRKDDTGLGLSEYKTVSTMGTQQATGTISGLANLAFYNGIVTFKDNSAVDSTNPTVTAFTMPATSNSTTVNVTTFTATDNIAVWKYLINESASTPSANDSGWSSSVPATFTFSGAGSRTAYAWAMDTSGNISASLSASVTITDNTAPTVTAFTLPSTANSLTVNVTAFTATDNVGVTGYLINESASTPSSSDPNWVGSVPTTYTFSGSATPSYSASRTAYAWAKDASGNVSSSLNASVNITLPPGVPTGLSFSSTTDATLNLSWSAAAGSVSGYKIYRGGTFIGTSTGTIYTDYGLNTSTPYSYTVASFDSSYLTSSQSGSAATTTLSLQVPPQFQGLITCTGLGNSSNCQQYASPADAKPSLYDGTAGTVYTDSVFGTKIKRVGPPTGFSNVSGSWVPNYPPQNAWSVDGRYLLVFKTTGGDWTLLDGQTYQLVTSGGVSQPSGYLQHNGSSCPSSGNGLSFSGLDLSPHWMRTQPHKFRYTCGTKILEYNADTGQSSTLWTAPSTIAGTTTISSSIITKDYANWSDDDTRVALELVDQNSLVKAVFVFDSTLNGGTGGILSSKNMSSDFSLPATNSKIPADVSMSPSGQYVIFEWNCIPGSNQCASDGQGGYHKWVEIFPASTLSTWVRIPDTTQMDQVVHSDSGYDLSGNEVYISMIKQKDSVDYRTLVSYKLSDGSVSSVNTLPDSTFVNNYTPVDWHVSMRSRSLKGYALVSTFNAATSTPVIDSNGIMQAEVFALKLDGRGTVYRIAHNQDFRGNYYFGEPHAVPNDDMSKVIFGSTWRNTSCGNSNNSSEGSVKDCVLPYVVELTQTPTVTTQSASGIGQTSATGNGNITSIGNQYNTIRGLVYGLTTAYSATTTESGSFNNGAFTANISNLTCGTTYHIAAYSTNSMGTSYGSDSTFTTSACSTSSSNSNATSSNGPVFTGPVSSMPGYTKPRPQIIYPNGRIEYLDKENKKSENSSNNTRTSFAPSSVTPSLTAKNLYLRDKDESVRSLQIFLNKNGYTVSKTGTGSPGKETSTFGPSTYRALIKFQKANNLTPTGYFGPETRELIKELSKKKQ